MKASEIREMSREEMPGKVAELKQELFNLRFAHSVGQLENPQKMKQTKREVARIKTVMKQVELREKKQIA